METKEGNLEVMNDRKVKKIGDCLEQEKFEKPINV
jgi:hypothetical protein